MNKFELLGRVGSVEINYNEQTGKPVTRISIGIPNGKTSEYGNKLYDNFFISFFNTEKAPLAENLADAVKKGDYIRVTGKLSIGKYKKPNEDKMTYVTNLIGFGYKKVRFDETERKFVDIDA